MTHLDFLKARCLNYRKQRDARATLLQTIIGEVEMVGKNAGNRAPTDAETLKVLQKFHKGASETFDLLTKQIADAGIGSAAAEPARARLTSVGVEMLELTEIITALTPPQLSEAKLAEHITAIHAGLLASGVSPKIGDIMSVLKQRFEGQYDPKLASALARKELQ